jgi:hypothetical protein
VEGEKNKEGLPGEITAIPENQIAEKSGSEKSMGQSPSSADKPDVRQPISPENETGPVPSVRPVEEPYYEIATEPRHRQLAVSLLVAPAYNGVDNLNNGQMGSDVGLLLTLGLSERWSFSTGAVYAKKVYDTGFDSNYSPGNGANAYDANAVDVDCRVLDIPLNVNYTFVNKGNTKVSLGTGISSYLMLREDYRFDIESYNAPDDIRLVNENQHWLSVLNLQANYEQQLSSRISLSLQPFMKVPLSDIGYAKVRLQSLGMAVSASWNFSL